MKYSMKVLITLLLIISCKRAKRVEYIRECIESHRERSSLNYIKDFTIYETYTLFENALIKKGFLKKDDKQSYINLFETLKLNNSKMLELKKQMYKEVKDFDLLGEPTISTTTFFCVKDYIINGDLNKEKTTVYRDSFDTLLTEDITENIQFIKNTPDFLFKDFNFRLPILEMIQIKLIHINGKLKN